MSAISADGGGGTRLRLYRNPLRLLVSAGPWRAAWYLAGYVFAVGWVLFSVGLTAVVTAAPVGGGYRSFGGTGLIAGATGRWRDPATWRDAAYLIGLWGPLFVLDTAVLAIWLTFLGLATLPVWYSAPRGNAGFGYTSPTTIHGVVLGYFPHGPKGSGGVGLYVDTLPKALLAAAIFVVAFLLFNYVVVLTARAHAAIARSLLSTPTDPLAEAKEVLASPGPLGPLQDKIRSGSPAGHP